ncbi:MAG: Type I Iterative PKS [Chrysothrix sp. TS-e1954]|nr:MAG: Type I Iterative PKS [Chrysothrix sp. TS-e1954]
MVQAKAATMTLTEEMLPRPQLPQAEVREELLTPGMKLASGEVAKRYVQEPVAVIGMACRLPGDSSSPSRLWDFLERGGIATNEPPATRFSLKGHYDRSTKPRTMRSPGGMFLENVDVRDIDAPFFGLSRTEAIAMDPQVRQVLEVVYECMENAGITLEQLNGQSYGCFVGSFAGDYADMQARDPEDRVPSVTIGIGRAMLSNRVSHFLNIKGSSMTIDTACSGSLVGLDVACRYLQTGEMSGAIVAGCNLYLNPEHNMDLSAMKGANTLSGRCHTFDTKADGYVKAEAVNCVILKKLSDAIADGDPIRAVIRGSATNSDGYTPGIASPSAEAQAAATRQAYINAGITNFNDTGYLECHVVIAGTGTQAGDPIETNGVSSVFAPSRDADKPLIVGSIKSNVGHSEPAAGLSGLLKAIMVVERGVIPGNPTFITRNPKINFESLKIQASRTTRPFPKMAFRRASLNSFGYGGSNAHVIVDEPSTLVPRSKLRSVSSYAQNATGSDIFADEQELSRSSVIVLSANDETSLGTQIKALNKHIINPKTNIKLADLAYTLSERRTRHFQRAYIVTESLTLPEQSFVFGKPNAEPTKVGLVFTGQGAQWPCMGQGLIEAFPSATMTLRRLDKVLQMLPNPPKWSLLTELTEQRSPQHMRKPEFSQPLVTAIQLVILEILRAWNVQINSVVGHSSGEIAAACAAGFLDPDEAIKVAFHRGQATLDVKASEAPLGMLAVGLGPEAVASYTKSAGEEVSIACYNSPQSLTLSGPLDQLQTVSDHLKVDGHFARLLQVDMAYHSGFMDRIGERYESLLLRDCSQMLPGSETVTLFSSVTGKAVDHRIDAEYWRSNMTCPVRFEQATTALLKEEGGANFLIEVGPSGALAGPVSQIKKALPGRGSSVQYFAALKRSTNPVEATRSIFDVAGRLFLADGKVDLAAVNRDKADLESPMTIIDLPNYGWNHSIKYWYENNASKEWRQRKFNLHDLLGSKILNTPWHMPSFKKILNVADLSWLQDHKMGHEIVYPAAGYIAMAMEAMSQMREATAMVGVPIDPHQPLHLRNVKFARALVLTPTDNHILMLVLTPRQGGKDSWNEFKISSQADEAWIEHCTGLVKFGTQNLKAATSAETTQLQHSTPAGLWYKAMNEVGYSFGQMFQKQLEIESVAGSSSSRSLVDLSSPKCEYLQSEYPMHPVNIDGCFQAAAPSLWKGHRSVVDAVLVPALLDELIISVPKAHPGLGLAIATSDFIGIGRPEETKNYKSSVRVFDPSSGAPLLQLSGLRYHKLDTREDIHAHHSYTRVTWKPNVEDLDQSRMNEVLDMIHSEGCNELHYVLDILSHNKPSIKVLELSGNLRDDTTSVWLGGDTDEARANCCKRFCYATDDPKSLLEAQKNYALKADTEFQLVDVATDKLESMKGQFDLVILKIPIASASAKDCIKNARSTLVDNGHLLLLEQNDHGNRGPTPMLVCANCAALTNGFHESAAAEDESALNLQFSHPDLSSFARATLVIPEKSHSIAKSQDVSLVHLSEPNKATQAAERALLQEGWRVTKYALPLKDLPEKSTVLILDDLTRPVLSKITEEQWAGLQTLLAGGHNLLWVTTGGQMHVKDPAQALFHGFARSIRAEDPSLRLLTLDVESPLSPNTFAAISVTLHRLAADAPKTAQENEFVERDSVIWTSRIIVDKQLNHAEKSDSIGANLIKRKLHDAKQCIRLRCERLGTLESLYYGEIAPDEIPLLGDNFVEVELYAAGLNFKDVAVTMGIVPENQHLLGLEGAGVVRRVGKHASQFHIGQRVLVHKKGCFANRVQATTDGVYPLPDDMSYEEASTLACVYLVSIYGLYHLANLRRHQTVLIHSAAGGVGSASIQLAQHRGAEVYATVGSDEKREYLKTNFGIPDDHIFSSRNTDFAPALMKQTNGKGVNVILNSLTGAILEESWRCVADAGIMVEIGKKDILDRNSLSMEPFNRNASFRAVDMSHKSIDDPLTGRLLHELFELIKAGHVKPIGPVKTFPFDDVPAAFRFMRGGTHIGKIIITSDASTDIEVPVRPAQQALEFNAQGSYLIVGGLKSLCGSLATYMARCGAKNLVVMSRSGCDDEKSQAVIKNVNALGCHVDCVTGDVARSKDVQKAFAAPHYPIKGVIQGAMVLRDRIFGGMSVNDFHAAVTVKVQGTWNLHHASMAQAEPLEFFTLLSSISGVIGSKAQANYAAANVFLDSFSTYRHACGLRSCTVDLGVIEDVGYVAERTQLAARLDTSLRNQGTNEALLHKIFKMSILQQISPVNMLPSAQLITGIPVPQKDDSALLRDVRFATLATSGGTAESVASGVDTSRDVQALLLLLKSKSDPSHVLDAAITAVNQQFTRTLALSEPMEPAKPLSSYGLDSLAAVEFRNWTKTELGAELTTLEITNAKSLKALCEMIVRKMGVENA